MAPTLENLDYSEGACTARGAQQAIGSVIGKSTSKSWECQLGFSSKKLFRHEGYRVSGMSHGDDFMGTGPTDRLADLKNNNAGVYRIKTKFISHGSTGQQEVALWKARSGVAV